MKKNRILISISIAAFLFISNIPLVSLLIGVTTGQAPLYTENPQFSSGLGAFKTSGEYLSGSENEKYADLLHQFEAYKKSNPKDTILYRHFNRNPLRFWEWYRYWLNRDSPFYNLPYKKYEAK